MVGAFVARLHVSQATLIPTRRWNTKCKSAFGTLQVVQNSSREIMKLTPLEVPTSLLRQPQDGNSNSQSRMNRPVTSNNTNLNKTQKGAEAMHYLEFVLIIVAAKKRKSSQTNFILLLFTMI